mmetsp:Transcript_17612/g.27665  ORF Transcript_17612/g.27665 Transcript_17612/m.27665 type:complete len:205 (-) Transcript_17612:17-631(-)
MQWTRQRDVLILKHLQELASHKAHHVILVVWIHLVAGEIIKGHRDRHLFDLLLEQVVLVEEQEHRFTAKKLALDHDGFEQVDGLHQTVRLVVLKQLQVVVADGDHIQHRIDVLVNETHPFLALRSLSAHIGKLENVLSKSIDVGDKFRLREARRSRTNAQIILKRGHIRGLDQFVDALQKIRHIVVNLIIVSFAQRLLNTCIRP